MDKSDYVRDCYSRNVKISGIKIARLLGCDPDYSKIYSCVTQTQIPICVCGSNVNFIRKKRTFAKFCGMKCASEFLSKMNTLQNKNFNKEKSTKLQLEKLNRQTINEKRALDEYSGKNLRGVLVRNNLKCLPGTHNPSDLRKQDFETRHAELYKDLSEGSFIREKKTKKWIAQDFAEYYQCSKNHIVKTFRENGHKLPSNSGVSSGEYRLGERLEKMGYRIERSNRKILNGKEIDIWMPEYNLGIEYNGMYWHSHCKYSQWNKAQLAIENKIKLLQFWCIEVENNIDDVLREIDRYIPQFQGDLKVCDGRFVGNYRNSFVSFHAQPKRINTIKWKKIVNENTDTYLYDAGILHYH